MGNLAVLGTQWGDEGKGKIIDLLAPSFDIVARYQGGHNAGHTVYVGDKKIVLHLLPSGILHPGKLCVIGNGVVIHPRALLDEIAEIESLGFRVDEQLLVSKNAHLILPYHMTVESISEELCGEKRIGTTSRGIGPAYQDKAGRLGIRAGDLLNLDILRDKIERNVKEKNILLSQFGREALDAGSIFDEYARYSSLLKRYIRDVSKLLDDRLREGKTVLFEGAQGSLLDIDHGTYPYVTSSNSTAGGICTGLGIGPDKVQAVLGVTKAYTTRVGGGPFPTEIGGETGRFLLEKGREFGATTGRPRRCGWFDAVAVSYACRINGIGMIALTKPDVLDGLEEIKVCVGYRYKNDVLRTFPEETWVLEEVRPVYRAVKGWGEPVVRKKQYEDLPQAFKDYVRFIEDGIQAEAGIISTGVERRDTILRDGRLSSVFDLRRVIEELRSACSSG